MTLQHEWLLIFPPLISSNWGSYYPSLAILAAVLRQAGFSSQQLDLNEELLDYLLDRRRLEKMDADFQSKGYTREEDIPLRAALRLLLRDPSELIDADGLHVCDGEWNGHAMAVELSRHLHTDLPIECVSSPLFREDDRVREYLGFIRDSSFYDAVDTTSQAVGISVPMGPQLAAAVVLAREVKLRAPRLRVVVGGATITLADERSLGVLLNNVPEIDALVRHEGERPILALAEQLRCGNWEPQKVFGVVTGSPSRAVPVAPCRMSEIPFGQFDERLLSRLARPRVGVQQARGCYWGKCSYCDFIELYSMNQRYSGRPTTRVVDEVAYLGGEYGVDRLWLVTEALPPRQAVRFAQGVIDRQLRVDWRSFAMVDLQYTEDIFRQLVESGCSSLTIGLETMCDRVLQLVHKQVRRADNLEFLERAAASGLRLTINLIPNLPSTSYAEAMATLDDLRPFRDGFHNVAVFPFEATASSAIGRAPHEFGLRIKGRGKDAGSLFPNGQAQFCTNRLAFTDPAMTAEELAGVFAAYDDFCNQVRASLRKRMFPEHDRPTRVPTFRFNSPECVVMADRDRTLLYDWASDRLTSWPRSFAPVLEWMVSRQQGVRLGELADFFNHGGHVSRSPDICRAFINALESGGVGNYG